jgi:hypothetical protein
MPADLEGAQHRSSASKRVIPTRLGPTVCSSSRLLCKRHRWQHSLTRVGRGARWFRPLPRAPRPWAKSAPRAPRPCAHRASSRSRPLGRLAQPFLSAPHPTPSSRLLLTALGTLTVDCPARLSHHGLCLPLLKCLSKH